MLMLTVLPTFHPQPMISNNTLSLCMYLGPIPWKGLQVIVQKQGDHHCTMMGLVTDVLLHQSTASSLRVQIMYDHFSPAHVMNTGTFDYDDMVEIRYVSRAFYRREITDLNSSLGLPLLAYLPLQYSQHAFQLPRSFDDKRLRPGWPRLHLPWPVTFKSDIRVDDGSRTPPQTETAGDTSSAWKPQLDDLEESADSLALAALLRRKHWLLNEALMDVPLRVYLDGIEEKGKDVEVLSQKIDDKVCITKKKQRSRELVDANQITTVHLGV